MWYTESSATGNSASSAITNQQITVKGGDNSEFTNIFNAFGDKTNDFQAWISDLGTNPDIVGGDLDEIHDVIAQTILLGKHNLNYPLSVDQYLDDEEWIKIANALENAYEYYAQTLSESDDEFLNTECQVTCAEGTLDREACVCNDCDADSKCCGLSVDQAADIKITRLYHVYIVIFLMSLLIEIF